MTGRANAAGTRGRTPGPRLRDGLAVLVMALLCLLISACASWQQPAEFDDSTLRERVESQTVRGVRLSAAVLSSDDSKQMFGVRVNESGVQPVWIEVENNTDQVLWLLRSGTDPDLFSPLEVAWSFHSSFSGDANSRLDRHFDSLGFQNPVAPGERKSGILFTNPHDVIRMLSVDILGQRQVFPFTMFLSVPDHQSDELADAEESLFERLEVAVQDYRDVDAFRARLQQLPCCATNDDGSQGGDPLNLVLIGEFVDIASAFVRRGFRFDAREFHYAQQLFGRPPDLAARRAGHAGVPAHWLRVWLAPYTFEGQPVFIAQTARQQGWRATQQHDGDVLPGPRVDEVRNALVQDMTYSGGLQKLAYDRASDATAPDEFRSGLGNARYQTDGLRAILFFITRPLSLEDIEILDWLPLYQPREIGVDVENADAGD